MRVVLDTCVLVDLFVESRDRHALAMSLAMVLKAHAIQVLMPWHAMFELAAAVKREARDKAVKFNAAFTSSAPFSLLPIPIDESFFAQHFSADLPYLRAGDLIFLVLAKGEAVPLISEDQELLSRSREAGIDAYTMQEFIAHKAQSNAGA